MKFFCFVFIILLIASHISSRVMIRREISSEYTLLLNMSLLDAMSSKVITPEQEKKIEEILDENAKRLNLKKYTGK